MPKKKKKPRKSKKTNQSKSKKDFFPLKTPPQPAYHLLANPDWATNGATTLLVRCYRMLNIEYWPQHEEGDLGFESPRARAVFVHRRLTYFDTAHGIYPNSTGDAIESNAKLFVWPDLPKAHYLLVVSGFDGDGNFQSLAQAQEQADIVLALLNVLGGRNMGFDKVFEMEVELATGHYIGTSGPINLGFGSSPDLTDEGVSSVIDGFSRLDQLPEPNRNRVYLSLRWFAKGIREPGQDGFISLWIAIETLAMPNETDVRSVVQALSDIYGIPEELTRTRFQIGWCQGLRSQIVHDGKMVDISPELNRYLEAVYRDLLFDALGLNPELWTGQLVSETRLDIAEHLQQLS